MQLVRRSLLLRLGLAPVLTVLSVLPSRADLAPKWSDAELLAFSDVVVTGTVVAVATGWDNRTVYTYVTLDVGDVIKGWIPERQIVVKQLGGRVDDLALTIGGQAVFTAGEQVLVFLEARRGDRTLSTTALWQGKWTISTDAPSGERLATRRLPATPDRRAFGLALDVRAHGSLIQALRAQAGEASRSSSAAVPAFVVYPRESQAARPVVEVDATAIMNGVWGDGILDGVPALVEGASADCFTRFTGASTLTWTAGDLCGDMGASGGTLSLSGYWARAAIAPERVTADPFLLILQAGVITNGGASAATYLTPASCAAQIRAHEMAHARGRSHAATISAMLDRSCATPGLSIQSQSDALVRAAAGIGPATVTSSTFTIAWDAPNSGAAPTSYIVEAGSAPGLADLARFTVGTATSYLATAVAPGTYYVRVRAANAGGISSASNEISATVVGPGSGGATPAAPSGLASTANGSTVTLTWNAAAGSTATAYWIEAGSATGISDLAGFSTGSTATSFMATGVGAGSYFVRVKAMSSAGIGPASNEIRLTVAGASSLCSGAPGAPGVLTTAVTGSTMILSWAGSAGLPTSYVVEAGSSTGSSDLANFDTASTSTTLQATGVGRQLRRASQGQEPVRRQRSFERSPGVGTISRAHPA